VAELVDAMHKVALAGYLFVRCGLERNQRRYEALYEWTCANNRTPYAGSSPALDNRTYNRVTD